MFNLVPSSLLLCSLSVQSFSTSITKSNGQLAKIAVGHDSGAVTLVSGLLKEPLFADQVEHNLHTLTPDDVDSGSQLPLAEGCLHQVKGLV